MVQCKDQSTLYPSALFGASRKLFGPPPLCSVSRPAESAAGAWLFVAGSAEPDDDPSRTPLSASPPSWKTSSLRPSRALLPNTSANSSLREIRPKPEGMSESQSSAVEGLFPMSLTMPCESW